MIKKLIPILILTFTFTASLFLYHTSLNLYFFQDDFFEINISKAQNFNDYLGFFKFRDDIVDYRPISQFNYFFLLHKIFALNPIGYRIVNFIILFLCIFLIVKVISKITKDPLIAQVTAITWALSSIHFLTITWIAAGTYNIIGTFFWLLTSLFFLNHVRSKKLLFYNLSIISYLLTLGSFELSVSWPVVFGFYYFYTLNNPLLKSLKTFSPYIFLTLIFLSLRLLFLKIPDITEYQIILNLESVKAFLWYLLWAFNIPEEFRKQIVNNLIIFNREFIQEYWQLVAKSFIGMLWIIFLGIILPLYLTKKRAIAIDLKILLFFLLWFSASLLPVLIIPNHAFAMYLTLAAVGLYAAVSYLIIKTGEKILVLAVCLVWLLTSQTTLNFYKVNYWTGESQKFAREFTLKIKKQYPKLPASSVILFEHNDKRHIQALHNSEALRAIYNDSSLTIYYNKEALFADLQTLDKRPIYIFTPNEE